ncbi:MAG: hypothetical protein RBU30_18170, partial [Polyangia bacterium]|nr:hypothetical protein [Polyangia bacterium]
ETLSNPGGIVEDLAVRDGKLFVAMGPWGLAVLEAATLAETSRLRGNGVGGASAIAWCGGRLCVARRGARGLSVVEPGWRRAPEVVAEHLTDHGSQDIAVSGGRIFLAHGSAGVGVYHLASPSALTHLETFQVPAPGSDGKGGGKQGGQKSGRIVSVAALEGRLLAAAQDSGKVYLYDLSAGRSLAAVIALPGVGQLERVRFRGGQLWALSAHPEQASIYDVSAPSSPLLLGQVTSGAAEEFRAQYVGARRYSFGSNLVSVYRMEVMTP